MNWRVLIVVTICIIVGVFLYYNDPMRNSLAPKCWFKLLTGLSCPGCGFQRCVHAMLHGEIISAFKYNLFFAIGIPYLIFVVIFEKKRLNYTAISIRDGAAYMYILLYFSWFVVRNVCKI